MDLGVLGVLNGEVIDILNEAGPDGAGGLWGYGSRPPDRPALGYTAQWVSGSASTLRFACFHFLVPGRLLLFLTFRMRVFCGETRD